MDRLKDKIAIVTGGANGIGKAISGLLAEEGAWVLVTDIEDDAGNATVDGIRNAGGAAKFCHADVSSTADVNRAVETAAAMNGRVDILCNNAAYLGDFHAILESTDDEWSKCINVALMGTHYFTKATLPYMIKQRKGSIVNPILTTRITSGSVTIRFLDASAPRVKSHTRPCSWPLMKRRT